MGGRGLLVQQAGAVPQPAPRGTTQLFFRKILFLSEITILEFVSISAEFLRFILRFWNSFYDKQKVGCWKASMSEQMKTRFEIYQEAGC